MKTNKTLALGILMLMPTMMSAQTHVRKAFSSFIKNKDVEIAAKHSLEKDPETGKKEGQADIYTFTMGKAQKQLIRDLEQAFDDDKDEAYTIESGMSGKNSAYDYVRLAVGDGKGSGVALGYEKNCNYMYSCFLDPEDPTKTYRYAYGFDWKEKGDEISGQLVVTYATTQKFRQGGNRRSAITMSMKQITDFSDLDSLSEYKSLNGVITSSLSKTTLGTFNIYARKFKERPTASAASVYANEIYNLCKGEGKQLNDVEKNLITTEIHERLVKCTKDEFLITLLNAAAAALHE